MISQALKDVEILAGDTVLVHSDLTAIRNGTGFSWLNTAEAVKEEILKTTDQYISAIDKVTSEKEKDLMEL